MLVLAGRRASVKHRLPSKACLETTMGTRDVRQALRVRGNLGQEVSRRQRPWRDRGPWQEFDETWRRPEGQHLQSFAVFATSISCESLSVDDKRFGGKQLEASIRFDS